MSGTYPSATYLPRKRVSEDALWSPTFASAVYLLVVAVFGLLERLTGWFFRKDPRGLGFLAPLAFVVAIIATMVYPVLQGIAFFGACAAACGVVILSVGAAIGGQGFWQLLFLWPVVLFVIGIRVVVRLDDARRRRRLGV